MKDTKDLLVHHSMIPINMEADPNNQVHQRSKNNVNQIYELLLLFL